MTFSDSKENLDTSSGSYIISDSESEMSMDVDEGMEDYDEDNDIVELSELFFSDDLCESDMDKDELRDRIIQETERINRKSNSDGTINTDPSIPPDVEEFLGKSGTVIMPDNPTSISSVRKLFMPDELFEFMAERTNRAYKKKYEGQEQPKGLKWKNVTGDDIKKMLGMLIAMSYYNKDKVDEHWSTDSVGETPQFRRIMSKNRFLQIFRNWTCYDENEVVDKKDRLKMVRLLITYTQHKFKTVYKPR